MAEKSRTNRFLEFALIFAIVYLLSQGITNYFFPKNGTPNTGVSIRMQDDTVTLGHSPIAVIRNDTQVQLQPPDNCPMPPFNVTQIYIEGGAEKRIPLTAQETAVPCTQAPPIEPGKSITIDLKPWKYSLFAKAGIYELSLPIGDTSTGAALQQLTTRFTMSEPGVFTRMFRGLITKPILFSLISIAQILPGHSLGWSIILLTLLVKLLLFIPTQQALEGQRKMQLLQPKLDELKGKFKDDPVKLQQETMRLWKENNANPFQSCLPLLLQFPVLIGLFFVIREGNALETSREYLYPIHEHLSWVFDHMFYGLDLTKPHMLFPPLLVLLQFFQMKLSFAVAKRKQGDRKPSGDQRAAEMQQKVMLYALPLMIGYFALKFPSAVSLYWAVSTVFAVGQQIIVNREHMVRHGNVIDIEAK